MNPKYAPLFTPMRIGTCEIKNRVVLCAMEGTSIVEWLAQTRFNEHVHDYYIERARNGVGLIIPGMTPLRSMVFDKWLHRNPGAFRKVGPLMDEIHSYGAKVFFQLGAGFGRAFTLNRSMTKLIDYRFLGKAARKLINMDALLVSASENPNVWMPEYPCRELSREEIREFVEAYAGAALLCRDAGVDGIEVHAVHEGYLLDQFTTPYTNRRTDEYGGSLENRYRFACDVVRAIKKACGSDYPVSLRYSVTSKTIDFNVGAVPGEEFAEAGRTLEESEKAARLLQEAGYDALNADNGTYDAWYWAHPPVYMPLNCNLDESVHIKKFVDIPVICAGRMQADAAARAIADGKIDGVGIARQFLADPEFLTKIREDRTEDIRPCISCHAACLPIAHFKGGGAEAVMADALHAGHCALNPRTLDERKLAVRPAKRTKRIAVIGGGIAGMETARVCAMRGHRVTVYEKTGELAGVFNAAAAPSFKEKDKELIGWYRRQMEQLGIPIRYNAEVVDAASLDADEIIVATGARARKLKVPGGERAIDAIDYLRGRREVGERVAVIGGGLTGCEIAYDLVLKGKKPFIVEMLDDVVKVTGVCAANSNMLRDLIRYHRIPVYLETMTQEINDRGIVIEGPGGRQEIPADSVIVSIGYIAGTPLAEKDGRHLHILGDAKQVGNLKKAIGEAYRLALRL